VNLSLDELICALNPVLRGWTNYGRHNAAKRTFGYLSYYLWWRVVRSLRRKYPRLTWKQVKRRYWGRNWTSREGRRLHWPGEVPVNPLPRPPDHLAVGDPRNRPGHHPAGDRRCLTSTHIRPADVLWRAGCSGMGMSGSVGGGEETTSRKAGPAPRRRPNIRR
jgi:Group II intron, maturase-specific domain